MAVDLMTDGGNMFSVCRSICTTARKSVNATNDMEVAQMVLTADGANKNIRLWQQGRALGEGC